MDVGAEKSMPAGEKPRKHRAAREAAFVVLFSGCVFLLPPGARLFQLETKIAGIPIALVMLFVVWALLIVGTALASAGLTAPDKDQDYGP